MQKPANIDLSVQLQKGVVYISIKMIKQMVTWSENMKKWPILRKGSAQSGLEIFHLPDTQSTLANEMVVLREWERFYDFQNVFQ